MNLERLTYAVIDYADAKGADSAPLDTAVEGLSVVRSFAPTELEAVIYQPIFCLVLQGAKQAFLGDNPVTFGRLQSLIVSLDLPTVGRIVSASRQEPYVALALKLDATLLQDLVNEIDEAQTQDNGSVLAVRDADDAVVDAMRRLFLLSGEPSAAPVLAPLVKREIHYRLLTARHGAMLRRLTRPGSHASRIAHAVSIIRRDYTQSLDVTNLAREAGMSPSAFHLHFKEITATTPLQYQKQLRLLEARRLLLTGAGSVARVAFDVGYESPTQFSREYSRKFGKPPRGERAAA